jgi:hypothetical protein
MIGLTGPAPLPSLLAGAAAAPDGTPVVADILAARALDRLDGGLIETLQEFGGPGSVVTGTIEDSAPDGTVTVATRGGALITLHHPPELPLEPGASVALRIIQSSTAPQALILAVNGRPVTARGQTPPSALPTASAAAGQAATGAPPLAAIGAAPQAAKPPSAPAAASLAAPLSLENEAALEAAIDDNLSDRSASTGTSFPGVVAVLVRPAPVRLGQTPVPGGTRYLATVIEIGEAGGEVPSVGTASPAEETEPLPSLGPASRGAPPTPASTPSSATVPNPPAPAADTPVQQSDAPDPPAPRPFAPTDQARPPGGSAGTVPAAAADAEPPGTIDAPKPPSPAGQPPEQSPAASSLATPAKAPPAIGADFRAQVSLLAGRVVASTPAAGTSVQTALGTLAMDLPVLLRPGMAVELRITAVAPPRSAGSADGASDASPAPAAEAALPTLLEAMAEALAPAGPTAAGAIQSILAVQPGPGLAAAILAFLVGTRPNAAPRGLEPATRKLLLAAGKAGLAAQLDRTAGSIGTIRQTRDPSGWTVTILPYLGLASVRPMRLYQREQAPRGGSDERAKARAQRFVLELELKRLGPMQLDGLVGARRLDLMIRTRQPLAPTLRSAVERVFRDGLLVTSWTGEIGFSPLGKFPLEDETAPIAHLDLGV